MAVFCSSKERLYNYVHTVIFYNYNWNGNEVYPLVHTQQEHWSHISFLQKGTLCRWQVLMYIGSLPSKLQVLNRRMGGWEKDVWDYRFYHKKWVVSENADKIIKCEADLVVKEL